MKKSTIILIIIAVLVVIGLVWATNTRQANGPENGSLSQIDTEGWQTYTDNGLGFTFRYPSDWTLNLDPDPNVKKPRQEQVILQKGNVKIRIDPLGRRGAQSGPNPFEREELVINGISWRHVWTNVQTLDYHDYHRFTDEDGVLVLRDDPTTNGIVTSTGQSYTHKDNFRVHVFLENETNEEKRAEAINTAIVILKTLTIL